MDQFSEMKWGGSGAAFFGYPSDTTFEDLAQYARGQATPPHVVRIPHISGRRVPNDAIWIHRLTLAVSPKFVEALGPFTGWTTYPVEVIDGYGEIVPGYVGLAITGRCHRLVSDLDRIEGEHLQAFYVGVSFDTASWDGSDLFYPRLGLRAVITRPVHLALRKAKITNVKLEPLTEVRSIKASVDRWMKNRTGPYADIDDVRFQSQQHPDSRL